MNKQFDPRQVRRSFSRAAPHYAKASALQRTVETQLLESLSYFERVPQAVLDLGSGPGSAASAMRTRWPKAQVIAVDWSLAMLRQTQAKRWRNLWSRRLQRVCADARALPLADASVDVVFSNLCMQWIETLPELFAGLRRILKPGGLLLCSTFGSATLQELRYAFSQAEQLSERPPQHVSPFVSLAQFGDALMQAGFRDPVLDRDLIRHEHATLQTLMQELRSIGATNALTTRRRTFTGRHRFRLAADAYEAERQANGLLPATWEVISAMAWAPDGGMPRRKAEVEVAAVPLSSIPIRRR